MLIVVYCQIQTGTDLAIGEVGKFVIQVTLTPGTTTFVQVNNTMRGKGQVISSFVHFGTGISSSLLNEGDDGTIMEDGAFIIFNFGTVVHIPDPDDDDSITMVVVIAVNDEPDIYNGVAISDLTTLSLSTFNGSIEWRQALMSVVEPQLAVEIEIDRTIPSLLNYYRRGDIILYTARIYHTSNSTSAAFNVLFMPLNSLFIQPIISSLNVHSDAGNMTVWMSNTTNGVAMQVHFPILSLQTNNITISFFALITNATYTGYNLIPDAQVTYSSTPDGIYGREYSTRASDVPPPEQDLYVPCEYSAISTRKGCSCTYPLCTNHNCECDCSAVYCGERIGGITEKFYDCNCDCSSAKCGQVGGLVLWDAPCRCDCQLVSCWGGSLNSENCTCDCSAVNCGPGTLGDLDTCKCDCDMVYCGKGRVNNSDCSCDCQAVDCGFGSPDPSQACNCVCPNMTQVCKAPGLPVLNNCSCDCTNVTCPEGVSVNAEDCSCDCQVCIPPTMVSAQISDSGMYILVKFDNPTDRASMTARDGCGMIFTDATVALLGSSALCKWENDSALNVWLAASSQITVGSALTLRAGVLRGLGARLSPKADPSSRGFIGITRPNIPTLPTAVITSYEQISECDPLTIDGSGSRGLGIIALKFQWKLIAPSSDIAVAFRDIIENTPLPQVIIPAEKMLSGTTYTIELTVRDFMNQTASVRMTWSKSARPVPLVSIAGLPEREVYNNVWLTLYGHGVKAACYASISMNFVWNMTVLEGPAQALPSLKWTLRDLQIPSGTLLMDSVYQFTLQGSMLQDSSLQASASVILKVVPQPFVLRIVGGIRRTQSRHKSLTIETSLSGGHDGVLNYTYIWTCQMTEGLSGPCSGADVFNTFNGSTLSVPSSRFALGANKFTVAAWYSRAGQNYTSNSASIVIVFVDTTPPSVSINYPLRVNANQRVNLQAIQPNNTNDVADWM